MSKPFRVFTDGSAIGNPGPGGWAAVLIQNGKRWEISGSSQWTTISEMELRAAVEALRSIPMGAKVELRSDSQLLIQGMQFRVFRWQRNGWRNSRGTPMQHQQLWRDLLVLTESISVRWCWIKGHNGHPIQARADELAYQEARNQADGQRIAA
jgi:ribonuclease HI